MPFASREGCRLYWKLEGDARKPPLLLLNSIGADLALWDRSLPYLLPHFRLLRMDSRGHGASDAPDGDYSLVMLADDALAVMDAAGIERTAVAGVSLGGMVAMQLALRAPARIAALAVVCSSAAMDRGIWVDRIAQVRKGGTSAIADLAMERFLSPRFAAAHPEIAHSLRRGLEAMPDQGYAGAGAAIRDMDLIERLGAIRVPTLVVSGTRDISTPHEVHGARIAEAIAGAQLVILDAAHLCPVEAPAELAAALVRLASPDEAIAASQRALYEAGLATRRRVLGDEWVDRALSRRTAFDADFQDFITRTAWHEIWGRPGLDERTRRLVAIAITAALGRWEEFRLHVRAGLERDGFTVGELKEVLMQTGLYAGLPAANSAFAEAAEIVERHSGEPGQ